MSKTFNSTFAFKIAAIGSGKYGDLSFVLKPNHLFKRLMVQNIKTPDQLAVIAFCFTFIICNPRISSFITTKEAVYISPYNHSNKDNYPFHICNSPFGVKSILHVIL